MSLLNIASMGASAIGGLFSGLAQADAFKAQSRWSLLKQKQEALYKNDALRAAAKATSIETDKFEGMQKAAVSASNFGFSTGENRLFADTQRKGKAEIRSLNEQTTRETFEAERAALIDSIYYDAQARISKIGAYTSFGSGLFKTGLAVYDDYQENGEKSAWGKFSSLFGFGNKKSKTKVVDRRPA